ncbi:hypothetical protein ACVWY2_008138 [Bradyrhizobium sp. JR6.1]
MPIVHRSIPRLAWTRIEAFPKNSVMDARCSRIPYPNIIQGVAR